MSQIFFVKNLAKPNHDGLYRSSMASNVKVFLAEPERGTTMNSFKPKNCVIITLLDLNYKTNCFMPRGEMTTTNNNSCFILPRAYSMQLFVSEVRISANY